MSLKCCPKLYDMGGSRSNVEEDCLMEREAVYFGEIYRRIKRTSCRYLPGTKISCRWRQYVAPKHRYIVPVTQRHVPKGQNLQHSKQKPTPFESFPIHPQMRRLLNT